MSVCARNDADMHERVTAELFPGATGSGGVPPTPGPMHPATYSSSHYACAASLFLGTRDCGRIEVP